MAATQPRSGLIPLPVPWNTGGQADDGTPLERGAGWPPPDWPTTGQLTYTRELITVVLLVVALPWIVAHLVKRPRATAERIAARAVP